MTTGERHGNLTFHRTSLIQEQDDMSTTCLKLPDALYLQRQTLPRRRPDEIGSGERNDKDENRLAELLSASLIFRENLLS